MTTPEHHLDLRAVDQQNTTQIASQCAATLSTLRSLMVQYGSSLHIDDRAALTCAIEGLAYLLQPPIIETVVTSKPLFAPSWRRDVRERK